MDEPERRLRVALFQLRANRAPFLRATRHRWGRDPSAECEHCGEGDEDSEHFVVQCPAWAEAREGLGISDISVMNDPERCEEFLRRSGVLLLPQ